MFYLDSDAFPRVPPASVSGTQGGVAVGSLIRRSEITAKANETTTTMKQTNNQMYTPGQQDVIEKLRPIIELATSPSRKNLKITTRTNTLVTGPSGSGKSFLAQALAKELKLPVWQINVSSWIVLGARNDRPTLASLCEWISNNDRGLIHIDELEKPFPYSSAGDGGGEWFNAVRMELHDVLDSRMPTGAIRVDGGCADSDFEKMPCEHRARELVRIDVESKLRDSMMIIGSGTWQHLWTANQRTLGYQSESSPVNSLDQGQLMKSISPEVLLRFRNAVLFLRPMTEADFHKALKDRLALVPEGYGQRFTELVLAAIPRALEHGLGMRMIEEVFTDVCIEMLRKCKGDQEAFREVVFGYTR